MSGNNNCCDPCDQVNKSESVPSQLENLILSLLGSFTKTVTDGVATWSAVCDPNAEIPSFPRLPGEGFICYIIRILPALGFVFAGEYNAGLTYSAREVVSVLPDEWYIALQDVPLATPPASNPAYWSLVLKAPTGPQGPAGASGGGSAVNFATLTSAVDVLLTDSDAVVFMEPSAARVVTLPSIAATLAGKWYKINTTGAFNVNVTPNVLDTIDGAATYLMPAGGKSSIEIIAKPAPGLDWVIF